MRRPLGFVCAVGLVAYGSATLADAQVRISGLTGMEVVEVQEEGRQLILRSNDGRLFSLSLALVSAEELQRGIETGSPDVTVAEILDLIGAGISEKTITAYIQRRGAHFDLSANDLLGLKRAGATDRFLQFLIQAGGKRRFLPGYNGPRRQARPETTTSMTPSYTDPVPEGIPYYPYVYPGYTTYVGYAPYHANRTVYSTQPRIPRARGRFRGGHEGSAQVPSEAVRNIPGSIGGPGAQPPRAMQLPTGSMTRPSPSRRGGFSRPTTSVGRTASRR